MQKKHVLFSCLLVLIISRGSAQNVGINTDGSLPDSSAMLDIKSPNKGLLIPRIGTAARLALPNTRGLLVYDTASGSFWYNNGAAWLTIAASTIASGNYWTLGGNSTDTTQFIGTLTNVPFIVKVNNQLAGRLDPVYDNSSWGYQAGAAGSVHPAGDTATYARGNTAIGNYSLHSNFLGIYNTASGYGALYTNSNGGLNTATGNNALYNNSSGSLNTATGAGALGANTSGSENTAEGQVALSNNTTGSFNTAFGRDALGTNITGSYNTAIGAYPYTSMTDATAGLMNTTTIGYGALVDASNKIRLGNSAVTVIEGQVPFTTPSDGRYKYHVQEDVKGLDFILKLRPVTYQFDVQRFDAQRDPSGATGKAIQSSYVLQASYDAAAQIRRTGFIAQEVEKAAQLSGYDFSGIIKPLTDKDHYSLSYESFVVPLVKAVQEQQQTIAAQQKQLDAMQRQIDELKQLVRSKQ